MIDTSLLQTILSAYDLENPKQIEQIHNGTNRVYRFNYAVGSPQQQLAVKLSTLSNERNIASKHAEKFILSNTRPQVPCIPDLLTPKNEPAQTVCHPWGLLWNSATLVSIYKWVPSQPYRGLEQQLAQTGKCFAKLQQAFNSITNSDLQTLFKHSAHQRFKKANDKLTLDDNFTFIVFQGFISKMASRSLPFTLVQDNLDFLETEIDDLRVLTKQHSEILEATNLALVHLELSPSNFGYNEDHSVAIVFDFDSINCGLALQDIAWLCATFCIDYRIPLHQAIKNLTILLSAIQSQLHTETYEYDLLVPFMRLGYLDAIYRKLQRAYNRVDMRMGFVKEDILCLHWLRQYDQRLKSHIYRLRP
jgi:Ser/Thr protein kinase RdoA (MazF antagonist)